MISLWLVIAIFSVWIGVAFSLWHGPISSAVSAISAAAFSVVELSPRLQVIVYLCLFLALSIMCKKKSAKLQTSFLFIIF